MSISSFLNAANSYGFASPNAFEVFIHISPITLSSLGSLSSLVRQVLGSTESPELLKLYCIGTNDPALNIMTNPIREDDVPFEVPYGMTFEPIQMTFLLDANMIIRKFFESWHETIFSNTTKIMNYHDNYAAQVKIRSLSRNNDLAHETILDKCYPKSISGVSHVANDVNTIPVMTVDFAYHTKRTNNSEIAGVINSITGSQININYVDLARYNDLPMNSILNEEPQTTRAIYNIPAEDIITAVRSRITRYDINLDDLFGIYG